MFIKKIDGPRTVTLPDGSKMSRADLPSKDTKRWVASRKAAVVKGVLSGLISESEALERYNISQEEFLGWKKAIVKHGQSALKATSIQNYRQP